MNEMNEWLFVIAYFAIASALMMSRKPKFSRSIGSGEIPLQWYRLNVGDVESLYVKTAYFGHGGTFRDCGFSVPDQCLEKMVAILQLTQPRPDGSTLILITQSFATRIYDELWSEFEKKAGAVRWLDKRSWIDTQDNEMMQSEVDAFTVPEGGLSAVISHEKDASNGNRTVYKCSLGFQDSL